MIKVLNNADAMKVLLVRLQNFKNFVLVMKIEGLELK